MGLFYEDLEVGQKLVHGLRKTITEAEHTLFCSMTLNTQPLHIDHAFASRSEFGKPLVNGLFTLALAVGITVPDLTAGTIVANLGYETVIHPNPVFHGDTIAVETEILAKRLSNSRKECGIVKMRHIGKNQNDNTIIDLTRSALFLRRL